MKKNIKYIVMIILLIVILTYIFLVIRANRNGNIAIYKEYKIGDKFSYKGYEMKIIDTNIYGVDEFRKKYELDDYETNYNLSDDEVRICIVDMNLKRDNKESKDSVFTILTDLKFITKSWSTSVDSMTCDTINQEILLDGSLDEKEEFNIKIPFLLTQPGIRKKVMDRIKNENMWIIFPDYEGHEYYSKIKIN